MERERKMTQQEEILLYMQTYGSITRLEAACDLHIFELASRIGELKLKGYNILSTKARAVNKHGRVSYFNIYRLEEN